MYIGETAHVAARLAKHNEGSASLFTAQRRPVALAFSEQHPNRHAARARERQLKGWSRAKKDALVAGNLAALKRL